MVRSAMLVLLAAGTLGAQALPQRPEQIVFKPLAFEVPRAGAFQARLGNGIPVYLASDPDGAPFVRIRVLVKGGAFLDPAGKEGLAALAGSQMRGGAPSGPPPPIWTSAWSSWRGTSPRSSARFRVPCP